MAREETNQGKKRKPYTPPAILEEDDFSEEALLQFAPSGPFPNQNTCGGSGCPT